MSDKDVDVTKKILLSLFRKGYVKQAEEYVSLYEELAKNSEIVENLLIECNSLRRAGGDVTDYNHQLVDIRNTYKIQLKVFDRIKAIAELAIQ